MDCKKIQHVIFRFIYGEADEIELRQVQTHLERCKECRKEREIIAGLLAKVRGCFCAEKTPEHLRQNLLNRVKADLVVEPKSGDSPPL
jgi:predicted anti-sigma-YlaC factor YlaD